MNKLLSNDNFKYAIHKSKTFVVTGFRWSGTPQLLLKLIRDSFDEFNLPRKITIVFTSSATDPGLDRLAHPDLIDESIGSYYGSIPKIRGLIQKNLIKGYSLPQGQISLLLREIARGSPGLISKVGINTYVDPDMNGGKLNKKTKRKLIRNILIDNDRYLFYNTIKIDTAIIRGSIADKSGNISMIDEPVKTEFLSMAQAAKTNGGKAFVQVSQISNETLEPSLIDLPSHLVDGVILSNDHKKYHRQTNKFVINQNFTKIGNTREKKNLNNDPMHKKIIANNAIKFINKNDNLILGQGVPELVGVNIRKQKHKFPNVLTFMESGVIGGLPERRPDFGVAFNPSSFLTQDNQFVGFNGGHIDTAILSFVEFDKNGNVNVSYLGDQYFGCGGFIDICYGVKKILFVGSLTTKGLSANKENQKITIKTEGKVKKAVNKVKEITFSPELDSDRQKIFVITERCIFSIKANIVTIEKIYSGINLEKDVLANMDFEPQISEKINCQKNY